MQAQEAAAEKRFKQIEADFGVNVRRIVEGVTDVQLHERSLFTWKERQDKYFKALIIPVLVPIAIGGLLTSCGGDDNDKDHGGSEAKGGVYLGGVARLNEVENIKSLFPISINDQPSFHLAAQVYEGLVKFNQVDLSLMPALAYKWEISADQTEYTFHLRPIKFHDDACFPEGKGRAVTANDFKFCLDKLCTADPVNNLFDYTFKDRVLGANESYDASK